MVFSLVVKGIFGLDLILESTPISVKLRIFIVSTP